MKSKFSKNIGAGLRVLLIMVCFIPATAGAFAFGDGSHDKRFERKGHHRPGLGIWRDLQMIQKLDLTKEQAKQLRDADFAHREKCLALKTKLDGLHLKMDKAFTDDVVDDDLVRQLAEKISDVKGKLFVQDVESRLAFGKILSADQIEKLRLQVMHCKKQDPGKGGKNMPGRNAPENPFEN